MMCKGVMHLFWAAGALYGPYKEVSDAVCQRRKGVGGETKDELEDLHLKNPVHYRLGPIAWLPSF